jgi:hypothetical protein
MSGRVGPLGGRASAGNELDELTDLDFVLEGVAQVCVRTEAVVVAAPFLLVREVPVGFELNNDPLGGSLGDSYTGSDVTQSDAGRLCNQDEYPGVIGEKRPCSGVFVDHFSAPSG